MDEEEEVLEDSPEEEPEVEAADAGVTPGQQARRRKQTKPSSPGVTQAELDALRDELLGTPPIEIVEDAGEDIESAVRRVLDEDKHREAHEALSTERRPRSKLAEFVFGKRQ